MSDNKRGVCTRTPKCHAESQRRYTSENPEQVKESQRRYRTDNYEAVRDRRRRWEAANPDYPRRWRALHREAVNEQSRHYRQVRRERVRAIKIERGCVDCGYNAHPDALDFDHRPGVVKLFNIAGGSKAGWETILAEIEKCDVRCANCHRIKTAERREAEAA